MIRSLVAGILMASLLTFTSALKGQQVHLDVPFVPTPQTVVDGMLRMANVKAEDIVYDLGCGDGRIVITAAKQFGARGRGFDIDPQRIVESNQNAEKAGVTDKVEFFVQDLFLTNLSEATVVTLYLLPSVNERLRPKLFEELKPGTRVVSHAFHMGDWIADRIEHIDGRTVYFWVMPIRAEGQWQVSLPIGEGRQTATLQLKQEYQKISGLAQIGGVQHHIQNGRMEGALLRFSLSISGQLTDFVVDLDTERRNEVFQARLAPREGAPATN